jgi:hypothetical protein
VNAVLELLPSLKEAIQQELDAEAITEQLRHKLVGGGAGCGGIWAGSGNGWGWGWIWSHGWGWGWIWSHGWGRAGSGHMGGVGSGHVVGGGAGCGATWLGWGWMQISSMTSSDVKH